jgi:iron complex outermembrane recepter protein
MFVKFRLVLMLLGALWPPSVGLAQDSPATLAVTVRDSSGASMPGVTLRVVNVESRATLDAVSDAQGAYQATALAPGRYRVEAESDGFDPIVRQITIAASEPASISLTLNPSRLSEAVIVTARRVEEVAQEVPIPVSVVSGKLVADAGAFNVNRLKELIPTVQFYSSNPRNSAINIRGLGAPYGLTNDGIDPGVGLYIDGTFFARPAAATLDFLDVERVEVLRGPQGTLFGKNTTAGAINVTTRKPSFTPETDVELNFGSLGLVQTKASVGGALSQTVAGRISFSGTTRHGAITDVARDENLNGLNNLGFRGQLLYAPSADTAVTFAADNTRQRPRGYAQLVAGVAPTLRNPNRQYAQIAADLGYIPPSFNAFDRLTDADSPPPVAPGPRGRLIDGGSGRGAGPHHVHHRMALLGLGSVDRQGLHRTSGDDDLGQSVQAASMDAGDSLRGRCVAGPRLRGRRLWILAVDQFDGHARTGLGGGALPLGAHRAGGDARPARRLRSDLRHSVE